MTTDTSSISFTAYYTGEVWRRHGLSVPALSSKQGRRLYRLGRPLELLSEWALGVSNEILLLQRHAMIDHVLTTAIEQDGVCQVLEIACGLSPRGTRFCQRYPQLRYVEADLPGMAARKRDLLAQAGELSERHRVTTVNVLDDDGPDALPAVLARELTPGKPVLVITEGLINYFAYDSIQGFWSRLAAALQPFAGSRYVTDLYPNFGWNRHARLFHAFTRVLSIATRSSVTMHFRSPTAVTEGFNAAGFRQVALHVPEAYYGVLTMPVQRVPSLVRVVEARV